MEPNQLNFVLLNYLRQKFANPTLIYVRPPQPLSGGFETKIFSFQLQGDDFPLTDPMALRLYSENHFSGIAAWESGIQKAVNKAGYPAAEVYLSCQDKSILGGEFYIYKMIPGTPLMFSAPEEVTQKMGESHADLHGIDPTPLIESMHASGYTNFGVNFDYSLGEMMEFAHSHDWAMEGVQWLIENKPESSDSPVVCHGDFHALNILVDQGKVSGVVDWGGLRIADAEFDVANTLVLVSIPIKYVSASWEGFAGIDWNVAAEIYLKAYLEKRELVKENLDYFKARRCLFAIIQGAKGQEIWQHPMIVKDLIACFKDVSGIQIVMP